MTVQPLLFEQEARPVKVAKPKVKRRPKPAVATDAPVAYTSGVDEAGQRQWMLRFPAPAPLISVNSGRQHWRRTSPIHKEWRQAAFVHAKAAHLPVGLGKVRIDVVLRMPRNGRADAGNYYTHCVKPLVDGFGPPIDKIRAGKRVIAVGHGLIVDDTAEFLEGPFVTLGPKAADPKRCPFGEIVVTITDLSAVA